MDEKERRRLAEEMADLGTTDPAVYKIGGQTCVFSHIGQHVSIPALDTLVVEFYFVPQIIVPAERYYIGPYTGSWIKGKLRYAAEITPITGHAHKLLLDKIARLAGLSYQHVAPVRSGGDTDYADKIEYS